MRKIKFRAWNKKTKRMVDCHKTTPLAVHPDLLASDLDGVFVPFSDELEIMQYTGLKDKNGTEIYEGDIVKGIWQCDKKTVRVGAVKYWDNFGLYGIEDKSALISVVWKGCEVIGNIHDNPELLK